MTVQNCAVVRNGVADNIIVADPDADIIEGAELIGDLPPHVMIGSKWDGTAWEEPPPPEFPLPEGKPPPVDGLDML